MIDEKTLNKCIDNLAEVNANISNGALRQLLLEVGYILKQELDNVVTWNRQFQGDKFKGHQVNVQKLMEDNTQLFNENHKLHEMNMKLKEIIDQRIPQVEHAINGINSKFETFSEVLSKV